MPIITDKYDSAKIERLRHYIITNADKGNPRDYEIFVDSLKVVSRTNNPIEFDSFEDFVTEDSQKIRILIYNSANSPRNDQHVFMMREPEGKPMNGVDINNTIDEKLKAARGEWETELLKSDHEKLKKELEEAEDYIEKLEAELQVEKSKKNKIGDIHIGEITSMVLEGFARRNPQILAKYVPGGETLAGILTEDNKEKERLALAPAQETEASFKAKVSDSGLTEDEKSYLSFMKQLEGKFDSDEMTSLMQIIETLSKDTSLIKPVIELIKPTKQKINEEIQL